MGGHIKVAVRALVERCLRAGDLVIDQWDPVGTLEAIRAHHHVQKSRSGDYRSEVTVSRSFEADGWTVELEGRIDGLYDLPGGVVIEEIKTSRRNLEEFRRAQPAVHWGQAMVYSCLYGTLHGLPVLETRLVYCHLDTLETIEVSRTFSAPELEDFLRGLIGTLIRQREEMVRWLELRNRSIGDLGFPHDRYRPGQREMAVSVYRAVRDGKHLLVQAPTGIGKTMASLYPAIKALEQVSVEKILFLTARGTGQEAAAKAVGEMRNRGLRLRWLQLTAKEKTCFNPDRACTAEECDFARGYYDRVGGALEELAHLEAMPREHVEAAARRHRVCPFELSLNALAGADLVVCDYNYAFDPRAFLRRVFEDGGWRPSLLVDEAHNLVDRSREMFTAVLSRGTLMENRRRLAKPRPKLARALSRVTSWMHRCREACADAGGYQVREHWPEDFLPLLKNYLRVSAAVLAETPVSERDLRETVLDVHFEIHRFLRIAELYDAGFVTAYEVADGDFRIKLLCLDPSMQLRKRLEVCGGAVFFSATLTPQSYFREVFGCATEAGSLDCPSPFPDEHLLVLSAEHVSTLYPRRQETSLDVAELLTTLVRSRTGNYLAFFPSFEYLSLVLGRVMPEAADFEVKIQSPGMDAAERGNFLESFRPNPDRSLLGFAVMGGIFGESIDLVGDRLTGAAVVGVGLPGISPDRDRVQDYYGRKHGRGYEYAYTYPGINRVLQAAGRVIRTEQDRGVVLLIDERYGSSRYRRLLPAQWRLRTVSSAEQLRSRLEEFWAGQLGVANALDPGPSLDRT